MPGGRMNRLGDKSIKLHTSPRTTAIEMPAAGYPATRLRRLRQSEWSRRLVREHSLDAADLICPLFVMAGTGRREPVASMPGIERHSVDGVVEKAAEAAHLG